MLYKTSPRLSYETVFLVKSLEISLFTGFNFKIHRQNLSFYLLQIKNFSGMRHFSFNPKAIPLLVLLKGKLEQLLHYAAMPAIRLYRFECHQVYSFILSQFFSLAKCKYLAFDCVTFPSRIVFPPPAYWLEYL